jgi:hypothetical protein
MATAPFREINGNPAEPYINGQEYGTRGGGLPFPGTAEFGCGAMPGGFSRLQSRG